VNQPKLTKYSSIFLNQLCKLIPAGMARNFRLIHTVQAAQKVSGQVSDERSKCLMVIATNPRG